LPKGSYALYSFPLSLLSLLRGVAGANEIRGGLARLVCQDYRQILYVNPAVGVAVVVRRGEEVLWGRRRSGPYAGHWCIPCGYVEWGEEVRAAAGREFQ
jgi:8-oxo-dGTP pyrophosphatase MutT (NUDIX family)